MTILCAIASVTSSFAVGAASAAQSRVAASETIRLRPTYSGEPSSRVGAPTGVPFLSIVGPTTYARLKAQAKRASYPRALSGQAGVQAFAPGPAVALFGSLNAPGLSAAGDIALEGEAADVTPPDTTGAIGPNHYVEVVNNEIQAFSRASLAPVGTPVSLANFTGGVGVCDPQVKYDPQTERWFYIALRCDETPTENALYVGFSKTSDPTDFSTASGHGWCGYAAPSGEVFEDYPKLGLDASHIVIGTNSFSAITKEFSTAHILSVPKPHGPIVECPELTRTSFGSAEKPLRTSVEGHIAFAPEPATVADASAGGYVVTADLAAPGSGKNIMVWRVAGTGEKPVLEPLGAAAVPEYALPPEVPQKASTDKIDSSDSRLTQAVSAVDPTASAETIWTQHTVNSGSGGTVVRWYEILPGPSPTARQTGTITDATTGFAFNGAIAPTAGGGAAISYNSANSSNDVAVQAQSRTGSDPLGTMSGAPILLGNSAAIDADFSCPSVTKESGPCRWGDYAGASVDPTNGNVVWGSNQLNGPLPSENKAQWATRNFALTIANPEDKPPTGSFTPETATRGVPVNFAASATDSDGTITDYYFDFGDHTTAHGQNPTHAYAAAGSYTVTLLVTDNAGLVNTVPIRHTITVSEPVTSPPPPVAAPSPSPSSIFTPALTTPPNSTFSPGEASFNPTTGALTLAESVGDPGTFSWLLTFQNGKFGVFAASNHKCTARFVRLGGKCRPSRIVFAKGSLAVAGAGPVTLRLKPSASALKALKNALRQKKGLPVTITLTFQSARGGSPVSHTRVLTVKMKMK
jgi:PKD repeat protein